MSPFSGAAAAAGQSRNVTARLGSDGLSAASPFPPSMAAADAYPIGGPLLSSPRPPAPLPWSSAGRPPPPSAQQQQQQQQQRRHALRRPVGHPPHAYRPSPPQAARNASVLHPVFFTENLRRPSSLPQPRPQRGPRPHPPGAAAGAPYAAAAAGPCLPHANNPVAYGYVYQARNAQLRRPQVPPQPQPPWSPSKL